jgi:undecaprenyl-diphosphatase
MKDMMTRPVLDIKALLWKRSLVFGVFSFNFVLIAFFVFDMPLGAQAASLPAWLRVLAGYLTVLGLSGWILSASAFIFLAGYAAIRVESDPKWKRRADTIKSMAAYVFVSVALSGLIANLLKRSLGRARPEHFTDGGIVHFAPFSGSSFESFPSGHATTFGALAVCLCLLAPRFRFGFLIAGCWLAMTRVIIGAHYPSDVIAGFCFGAWFSWMMSYAFAKRDSVFRINQQGWPILKQPIPLTWKTRRD